MNNKLHTNRLGILGEKVKKRRQALKISQEKLANICSFDRTYISLIERGKRNISFTNLFILSRGLRVSISELTKDI